MCITDALFATNRLEAFAGLNQTAINPATVGALALNVSAPSCAKTFITSCIGREWP